MEAVFKVQNMQLIEDNIILEVVSEDEAEDVVHSVAEVEHHSVVC